MKRSALLRRTPLSRRSQLRSRPKRIDRTDPARIEWKIAHAGWCQCGCDRFSLHLHRHHVIYEQHVRVEGGNVWDLSNSMLLVEHCHMAHHSAARRIPLESVPESALAFAVDLLGEDRAALYVARRYRCEVPEGEGRWEP